MFMNMSNALIKHEQITTTLAKAKELKRFVEKIVTLGKKGDLLSRRKAVSILQDQKMTKKVFEILADRYKKRSGGYTRIVKLGNRFGDNAPMAVIELVDRDSNARGLNDKLRTKDKEKESEQSNLNKAENEKSDKKIHKSTREQSYDFSN